MLVSDARKVAGDWVARHGSAVPGFRGAFLTGSATVLPPEAALPPTSDVDVQVVIEGPLPPKPGKFLHRGVLLEVSHLPLAEVADAVTVLRSPHLAPSFATDQVLADPTGHLGRLRAVVAPSFAATAGERVATVLTMIEARWGAIEWSAPWPDLVTAWMFPASLPAVAMQVAALRTPTVRRRYVAARDVLREHGLPYAPLLDLLGFADVTAATVRKHLERLAAMFDATAAVSRTPFPFSADITPAARPVAIDGSRELIDGGDHREAVFWIVATASRCAQIVAVDGSAALRADVDAAFRDAVADLVGLRTTADLRIRRDTGIAALHWVRATAAAVWAEPIQQTPLH
ncbi:hypothetical protein [Pseudonocardia sp. GCM10023141]|uniref:hypothetical protein n=1 Tax=Pseudonocardia sp. GCM10023141 TaxID=3252653 RepID=UPI0036143B80